MLSLTQQLARDRASMLAQVERQRAKEQDNGPRVRMVPIVPNSMGQYEFLTDTTTEHLAAVGGIGSGKTWALMRWVGIKMRREAGRGTIGGIFANTYRQLETVTLPQIWAFFDQMGMEEDRDYVYYKKPRWPEFRSQFKKHTGVLSVRAWGQALVASLDDPDNVRGTTLGWAAGDELRDWSAEAFPIVLGRLRCPRSSHVEFRGSTTPNGFDWIYNEFVDSAEKHAGRRKMINLRTLDNAANLAKGYLDTLFASYDERFAAQELNGQFVSLTSGMVFYAFSRAVNRKEVLPIAGLPLYVSWDFNRTPLSVLIGQKIPRRDREGLDDLHILDEVRMENSGTDAACREVFRRLKGLDQKADIHVTGDASGQYLGNTNSNEADYSIITREFEAKYGHRFHARWPTTNPSIQDSVAATNGLCRNLEGLSRLFIHPRCVATITDCEQMKYLVGSKEIDKSNKKLTHAGDCLRYLVHLEFPLPGSGGGLLNLN